MKHSLWDRMMHRLLQEKKEKEIKASKSKGSKPDFLDLDKDGDKTEPMSKAAKEADGKKKSPKAKKGKGKVPPQLKMHIQKKKKSKLDEEIERLEKILFEELTDSVVQTSVNTYPLEEYGEDRYPDMAEEDDDDDFEDEDFQYDFEDDEGDEEFGDESFESEEMSDMDSDGYESGDFMEEGVEYLSEAEVKKKKPRLGKVTRNPSGSKKKFHVYVKCGGKVKKISFGDPGLSIKRDSAARRKNFRARHKCDKPAGKDRCTARYWSCYQWRAGKKVEGE